ncbi:MAG: hypothetical protein JST12_10930 [Armatimonadetes bacterium]|nr:hypothetical protein [Armatimonadota bacterium]MBS1702165.1 hypothetical protein [Armatimonadota bacterium]MBS1725752.1 hypothetical protein [Armatimonadota bacterium]
MKRVLSLSLIAAAAFALAVESVTPSDIVKSPDKFDKKEATVVGFVKKFKARTSKAGNDYFIFDLTKGGDKIAIYGHGKLEKDLKDGDKVEVKGIFTKEKTVGQSTFKNELDCSGKRGEKPNLKVLK